MSVASAVAWKENTQAVAIYDFKPDEQDGRELKLKTGDIIIVTKITRVC